jgi:hypothetical protein
MSNPLYQMLGNTMPSGFGRFGNLLQQFQQFRQSFHGDPRQQVQQLLNSGKVSQEQYNQAVQMANQLQKMMGGR